jgi:bifunctional DNase/RNase
MNIPVKVHAVIPDPNADSDAQIILLKDLQDREMLPIWVGMTEGNAIRFMLEGIIPPRPLSHDLLHDLLKHLHVEMEKVVITEINENVYFATLHLTQTRPPPSEMTISDTETTSREITMDARPSDAIALALRTGAPIYAAEAVLEKCGGDHLDAWLKNMKPTDFGPYHV